MSHVVHNQIPAERNHRGNLDSSRSDSSANITSQGSALMRVALIDQQIKLIVKNSAGLYLVALNAMLRARQLDERAAGFRRCTQDIRRYSDRLNNEMAKLLEITNDLVRQVSLRAKQTRLSRIIERAGLSARAVNDTALISCLAEIRGTISTIGKQSAIGENLVTRALIEAALTDQQKQLTYVAYEMEKRVLATNDSVKMINRILEEMENDK